MSQQRPTTRRRWLAALPIGLGGLACVACCTVPLWIAGGLTLGGTSLALDGCLNSPLPALGVLALAAIAVVVLTNRIRRHRRCASDSSTENEAEGCPCPGVSGSPEQDPATADLST